MAKQALVLYMPALHQGYLKLFREVPGDIFLIDNATLDVLPRLDRDIRAVESKVMQKIISGLYPDRNCRVLRGSADIDELSKSYKTIVMPREDVSLAFAERYLSDVAVSYRDIFLRWDKIITTAEHKVQDHHVVSQEDFAQRVMAKVVKTAKESSDWWRQVGAAIVLAGEVVLMGHNDSYPDPTFSLNTLGDPRSNFDAGEHIDLSKAIHAEARLIAEAAQKGVAIGGADMFVSTFPCPVCAKSIAAAGISRVYYRDGYSVLDAQDVLDAKGVEIIRVAT